MCSLEQDTSDPCILFTDCMNGSHVAEAWAKRFSSRSLKTLLKLTFAQWVNECSESRSAHCLFMDFPPPPYPRLSSMHTYACTWISTHLRADLSGTLLPWHNPFHHGSPPPFDFYLRNHSCFSRWRVEQRLALYMVWGRRVWHYYVIPPSLAPTSTVISLCLQDRLSKGCPLANYGCFATWPLLWKNSPMIQVRPGASKESKSLITGGSHVLSNLMSPFSDKFKEWKVKRRDRRGQKYLVQKRGLGMWVNCPSGFSAFLQHIFPWRQANRHLYDQSEAFLLFNTNEFFNLGLRCRWLDVSGPKSLCK